MDRRRRGMGWWRRRTVTIRTICGFGPGGRVLISGRWGRRGLGCRRGRRSWGDKICSTARCARNRRGRGEMKLVELGRAYFEMETKQPIHRCAWAESDPLMKAYHDEEWGVPVRDSRT